MFSDTTNQSIFPGSAGDIYNFLKLVESSDDLHVGILDAAETLVELTFGTHFDATGFGNDGGVVITYPKASGAVPPFDVSLVSTDKLIAWISPKHDQQFTQKNNKPYVPETIEAKYDAIARQVQDLKEQMDRKLGVVRGSSSDPDTLTVESFSKQKKLLVDTGVLVSDSIQLVSENWPAFYDAIELEVISAQPNPLTDTMVLNPIDNGVVITTNLRAHRITLTGPTSNFDLHETDWNFFQATEDADDAYSGTLTLRHHLGFVSGEGGFTSRDSGNFTAMQIFVQRHTTPGVRWDGINISTLGANVFVGRYRLWGLPRT